MNLWEYFIIYSVSTGIESGETLASSKEMAEGNVREYFGQFGQISHVAVRRIKRK